MTRIRHTFSLVAAAAVVVWSASCGDVSRSGKSPVYLVIDLLSGIRGGPTPGEPGNPLHSDVQAFPIVSPAPCSAETPCRSVFSDGGQVALRIVPKNVLSLAAPTSNNEVTISRFRVVYRRADGRNTPGVDVPYAFDGAVTGTVQVGSALSLGFELVRHAAKLEAPLANLVSNDASIVTTIAEVTFYGQDRVGNAISVTGSIQIDFGNFGG